MENCVQIERSVPGLQPNGLRTSNSVDDQLYGSAREQSIRLLRLNLNTSRAVYQTFPNGPGRCLRLAGPAATGASGPRGKTKPRVRKKRKQMD